MVCRLTENVPLRPLGLLCPYHPIEVSLNVAVALFCKFERKAKNILLMFTSKTYVFLHKVRLFNIAR